jgi:hypothetical protein
MELSNQIKKQLQSLMSDVRWNAVETALQEYAQENFVQDSVKKDSEFETLWYAAENEGGKQHLQRFFNELEQQARDVK